MRSKVLPIVLATVIGASLASIQALTQQQPPQLKTNKVSDDLYEIEGDGGNVAVLVTNEGVLLIDDKYDQDHDQIISNVKSVTDQPIKYVINTHYHADHSGGNAKFLSTAQIISTANSRANILQHKQSNAPPDVAPARITFTQEASVFLGGRKCGRNTLAEVTRTGMPSFISPRTVPSTPVILWPAPARSWTTAAEAASSNGRKRWMQQWRSWISTR